LAESLEKLRAEFLAETEDTLVAFRTDLETLAGGARSGRVDADVLNRAFRTVHSLKGVAGMFGLGLISQLAHALEDALEGLRDQRATLNDMLAALLFEGCSLLARLRTRAATGQALDAEDSVSELASRIRSLLANAADEPTPPGASADPLALALPYLLERQRDAIRRDAGAGLLVAVVEAAFKPEEFGEQFKELLASLAEWGTVHGTAPGEKDESGAIPAARVVVSGSGSLFQLARIVGALGCEVLTCDTEAVLGLPKKDAAASIVGAVAPPPAERQAAGPAAHPAPAALAATSLRVPVEKVDALLSELADLIQAKLQLNRAAAAVIDHPEDRMGRTTLQQSLRNLDRQLRGLQEGILGVRMISLNPLFLKLERVFHAACKESGKQGRFDVRGGGVELDRSIVQSLTEPFVHLIRNAVDHGLEKPEERAQIGKDPLGTVSLRARAEGAHTLLEVADDGRGINLGRVLMRGRALGLAPADARPTRAEVLDLIFRPGLTVREAAGSLSGRGVGLDAVREAVAALGGLVEVETGPSGTCFRLRLPTALTLAQGMEVRAGDDSFILPLAAVVRVIKLGPADVEKKSGSSVARLDEQTIAVRDLGEMLGLPPVGLRPRGTPAVLVGLADQRAFVLVDGLGRRREIVMKPLGGLLPQLPGISGCAESADGRTLLVLDPRALVDPTFGVAAA
jgi:two-component system chemotaxis sensor kinase CheA